MFLKKLNRAVFCILLLAPSLTEINATAAEAKNTAKISDEVLHQFAPEGATQTNSSVNDTKNPSNQFNKKYFSQVVATANRLATESGWSILKMGGNAVDAAVCIQMVLTLVEPQSSGIGGGGFLVLGKKGGEVRVFDGRETAPLRADDQLFLDETGKPIPFKSAQLSSKSVGVPGLVAMLWQAHHKYGKLPWKALINPAIELANHGFPVSQRLHDLLSIDKDLINNEYAKNYFFQTNKEPWPVGHLLKNPELAVVLQTIATKGGGAFYKGKLAQTIVDTVNTGAPSTVIDTADFEIYKTVEREPLCFEFDAPEKLLASTQLHRYKICGAPPPSSGTLAMAQILGILSNTRADKIPFSPEWLHFYTEAARLALADRDEYVGDLGDLELGTQISQDGNKVSNNNLWKALINADYLEKRAQLIEDSRMDSPTFGVPAGLDALNTALLNAPMPAQPENGTTHISIVDRYGNSLALTSSIESAFGSHKMVNSGQGLPGGFLLNSQLTDFSFTNRSANGQTILNRVGPGKRPRSSMTPTLVFEVLGPNVKNKANKNSPSEFRFKASLGSPGGVAIIHFTTQTLWAMLKWGLTPQEAINLPHFAITQPKGSLFLEQDLFDDTWTQSLKARQQNFVFTPLTSGVQAVEAIPLNPQDVLDRRIGYLAGADKRREGKVMGR